ncbi:Laminin subunit alpha-2, partial [Stegodyphus mimosarum]
MLPKEFLGEKTRSYNGVLKFHIESHHSSRYPDPLLFKYPLIVIEGNNRNIVHSPFLPVTGGKYSIRLHEDEWSQLEVPEIPVTRMLMMFILQNVQHIFIRATEGADVKIARLRDVSMETAVPITPNPVSPYVAVGIEVCDCPKEYGGLSCQDPGKGYYRKRKLNFENSTDLLDQIGISVPCPCNNRSEMCDPETGYCQNCRENTAGAFCELCAKGFFGDPIKGSCHPCECPLVDNSFSDTCEGNMFDHVCTNCQVGYEGKHCERCSQEFYGTPAAPGGSCKPCNCNKYGSLNYTCDRMTGQCHCRRG